MNIFYEFRCIWENRIVNVVLVVEEKGDLQSVS
jgi:hypothetical protein